MAVSVTGFLAITDVGPLIVTRVIGAVHITVTVIVSPTGPPQLEPMAATS